jgi:signal transduction histidine kinase
MHVDAPVGIDDALADPIDENFALRRSQWIGIGALVVLLIALAVILFRNADNSVNDLKSLSNDANTTSNLISTQHESLQFASSFERWLSGTTTRSNLEIRRQELAQRLALLSNLDVTSEEQVTSEYLRSLRSLDSYLVGTPSGFLSTDEQVAIRSSSDSDLNMFIMLASQMAGSAADGNVDPLATLFQDEIVRQNSRNAALLVALALIFLVAGFIAFTHLRDLKKIRNKMGIERQKLDESNVALKQIDDELQLRLDQERIDRAENEWLNTTVRSISMELRSTIVPDTIAESLVKGLGQALGVDVVLFYSFAKHPMPRLWKQWHLKSEPEVEESVVTEHESDLLRLMEHLWNRKRKIIVTDSNLIDIEHDPIPKLATITQMGARSWVMVPLGAGTQVLGCVAVGMVDKPRIWSPSEIELIEKVTAEVADVFIQARLFRQSMQITENDAEVNRLVELDKIKNDLIENMNHELRTPLTSIIGYLEVIVDDINADTEPELASSLAAVQRNAVRLQSLMDNMMRPSKANFHDVQLNVVKMNIGHLLSDLADSLQLGIDDSGVTMKMRLESPLRDLIIDGDVLQLEQVFVNLMSNAIKYTPRGGTVTVSARRVNGESKSVEIKVKDTGIGIPAEEFPNVFQRFFRASTATMASIPGFGIGLSLVHSIVLEHHGTITFDSTVGKGTVFTVTLPTRYVSTKSADIST